MRRDRCLSCGSANLGYPLSKVATPPGGLYVRTTEAPGFADLVLVSVEGRWLSGDDLDASGAVCLDCNQVNAA